MNRRRWRTLGIAMIIIFGLAGLLTLAKKTSTPGAALGQSGPAGLSPAWSWQIIQTGEATGGLNASLAIDPAANIPYISYSGPARGELWLASPGRGHPGSCGPRSTWICEALGEAGTAVMNSSIDASTVGAETILAISYFAADTSSLRLFTRRCTAAACAEGVETIEQAVGSEIGRFSSVKIGPDGRISIAYSSSGATDTLKYASQAGSGGSGCTNAARPDQWNCETVDQSEGKKQYVSLDLNAHGTAYLAYYDEGAGDLKFAWKGGGYGCGLEPDWSCLIVDGASSDVGRYASLYASEGRGDFHQIAYYDATNGMLKFAESAAMFDGSCGEGNFDCYTIDSMQAGGAAPGLAMTVFEGTPWIAYGAGSGEAGSPDALKIARLRPLEGNCGAQQELPQNLSEPHQTVYNWICTNVNNQVQSSAAGLHPSIASDSNGRLFITYQGTITNPQGETQQALELVTQAFQRYLPRVGR